MNSRVADGGMLLKGPYVMVAPDFAEALSSVKASTSLGSV